MTSDNYGIQSGQYSRDKTHCDHGHKFTPETTRIRERKNRHGVVTGRMRICIPCSTRRSRNFRIEKRIVELARELGMLKE